MGRLALGMFIVPTIALTLVITLYSYFSKRVAKRRQYQRFVLMVATTAFILNFIWEVAQGPLYENFQYDWKHISFCALASVADMFMVLVLFFGFSLIYKNVFWISHWNTNQVATLVLVGGVGAILSERWHITQGDWAYAESMPVIPVIEVGLSPVLQFAILPLIIFLLSRKLITMDNYQLK